MSEEQKQNTTGQPRFISVDQFQAIVEPLTLACERLKVLSVQSGTILAENVVEGRQTISKTLTGDETDGPDFAKMFLPYKCNTHLDKDGKTPHGLALIIANENFTESKGFKQRPDLRRLCAPKDAELLKKTLQCIGYRVVVMHDATVKQMTNVFDQISQNSGEGDLRIKDEDDSFICAIGSHGKFDVTDLICGSDCDNTFDLRETVYEKLGANVCPHLKGKAKLFFVQACRGNKREQLAEGGKGNAQVQIAIRAPAAHRLPQGSDFFFSYATAPGKFAYAPNMKTPCNYFKVLCSALESYSTKLHLMNMVHYVHQQLQAEEEHIIKHAGEETRHCPHISSSLRGPIFFFDSAKSRFVRSFC